VHTLRFGARHWLLVTIGLVFLAAGMGVLLLRLHAESRRVAEIELRHIQVQAWRVSANEWQAIGQGYVTRELRQDVDVARHEIRLAFGVLQASLGAKTQPIEQFEAALQAYEADVEVEFALLENGRARDAQNFDKDQVDPTFHTLIETIDHAVTVLEADALQANLIARVGSLVIVLAALSVSVLLLSRFQRSQRATELLAIEKAALGRSERRFKALVQRGAELVAILDRDGHTQYESPPVEALLGPPPVETGRRLSAHVHPDDRPAALRLFQDTIASPSGSATAELRLQAAEGAWRSLEVVCRNLIDDPDVRGLVINARDVTERRALEAQLAYRAFHDPLTELPNRALLVERLGHALARGARTSQATAIMFLDLDDFKLVNDNLGHNAGDQLLLTVAQRLRATVRRGDTAARLGGDEFVVLLEDLTDLDDVERVAQRLIAQLAAPIILAGRRVSIGASIGIAVSGAAGVLPDDLLRRADVAMYAAKTRGKGRYALFEPSMETLPLERFELEADLRRGLEHGDFRLHYQPIVELRTGRITGLEALLRWQHPTRGLVSPADFVPLAEQTGLIVPIGRWVLREACSQALSWSSNDAGPAPLVSVNLSGRQFQDAALIDDVAQTLRSTGLAPERLKLEITESVAMESGAGTIQTLQALKMLGVQLAIDDFGTGYSSLAYLKRFPVDTLKIDRAFVNGVGTDEQDTAIVRSIIALAKTLNLSVTAEGIETADQAQQLGLLECDEAQGYYFARPQPEATLASVLAAAHLPLMSVPRAA
jgi:diguanylate cyclase (GGDEF)-like protein/PAS domain S-box-containing protein